MFKSLKYLILDPLSYVDKHSENLWTGTNRTEVQKSTFQSLKYCSFLGCLQSASFLMLCFVFDIKINLPISAWIQNVYMFCSIALKGSNFKVEMIKKNFKNKRPTWIHCLDMFYIIQHVSQHCKVCRTWWKPIYLLSPLDIFQEELALALLI